MIGTFGIGGKGGRGEGVSREHSGDGPRWASAAGALLRLVQPYRTTYAILVPDGTVQ